MILQSFRCIFFLDWGTEDADDEDVSVWEDNWEDDIVQDDFNQQLRLDLFCITATWLIFQVKFCFVVNQLLYAEVPFLLLVCEVLLIFQEQLFKIEYSTITAHSKKKASFCLQPQH